MNGNRGRDYRKSNSIWWGLAPKIGSKGQVFLNSMFTIFPVNLDSVFDVSKVNSAFLKLINIETLYVGSWQFIPVIYG